MKARIAWSWIAVCALVTVLWLAHFRAARSLNPGGFSMGYGVVYFKGLLLQLIGFGVLEIFRTSRRQLWCSLGILVSYAIVGLLIAN